MKTADRLHALDAVRAFALLLGVVHHAALSFNPDARISGLTPVQDISPSAPLSLLAYIGHMFRMPLFFMMAGLFARMMVHRKGVGGFCTDRVQRILVPLVVAWVVFFPVVNAAWSWGLSHTVFHSPLINWPPRLAEFPVSYLWFLYYLLVIYGLALLARVAILSAPGTLDAIDRGVRRVVAARWLGPLALSVPIALALLLTEPDWSLLSGIATPNGSAIPAPLPVFAYGLAFGLGWMLSRNMDLLAIWRRRWSSYLTAALLATVACTVIAVSEYAQYTKPVTTQADALLRATYALVYAFAGWCWAFTVIGFALRFLSTVSPTRRYLADASYWIYLLHYPIVLILQDVLADVRWHWVVKFSLILGITLAICLATYQLFVRFTVIGGVLNGRRLTRGSALKPLAPVAQPPAQ